MVVSLRIAPARLPDVKVELPARHVLIYFLHPRQCAHSVACMTISAAPRMSSILRTMVYDVDDRVAW